RHDGVEGARVGRAYRLEIGAETAGEGEEEEPRQHHQRHGRDALAPPVAGAGPCRAKPLNALAIGTITHGSPPFSECRDERDHGHHAGGDEGGDPAFLNRVDLEPVADVPEEMPDAVEEMVPECCERQDEDQTADPRGQEPVDAGEMLRRRSGREKPAHDHDGGENEADPGGAMRERQRGMELEPIVLPEHEGRKRSVAAVHCHDLSLLARGLSMMERRMMCRNPAECTVILTGGRRMASTTGVFAPDGGCVAAAFMRASGPN